MDADQIEEIKRHFGIVAEALRGDVRRIAEEHSVICHEIHKMRNEFRNEFKEMRAQRADLTCVTQFS